MQVEAFEETRSLHEAAGSETVFRAEPTDQGVPSRRHLRTRRSDANSNLLIRRNQVWCEQMKYALETQTDLTQWAIVWARWMVGQRLIIPLVGGLSSCHGMLWKVPSLELRVEMVGYVCALRGLSFD